MALGKDFEALAERIKAAKREDARTLAVQVRATEEWKAANARLTELNKEMDQLLNTIRNNAVAIELDKEGEENG